MPTVFYTRESEGDQFDLYSSPMSPRTRKGQFENGVCSSERAPNRCNTALRYACYLSSTSLHLSFIENQCDSHTSSNDWTIQDRIQLPAVSRITEGASSQPYFQSFSSASSNPELISIGEALLNEGTLATDSSVDMDALVPSLDTATSGDSLMAIIDAYFHEETWYVEKNKVKMRPRKAEKPSSRLGSSFSDSTLCSFRSYARWI
ncbi:hypothetical protein PIIN_05805 [Serendipita indica DSM 11827]|uniref:Uncharacterized protein n=1 Tax=Serendipita indica (strain DSM 11827) TaxID=1109443 RepID=G4TKM7_SERID|nr:hypothetical protein PIIN_05805 [Serendipita indica DSM 11827]